MVKNDKKNITIATESGLCLKCGACYAVCPVGAISIDLHSDEFPIVNLDKCNKCGMCFRVCPGLFPDQKMYSAKDKVGPVSDAYVGYAVDKNIHGIVTSGGVCTAISTYLLRVGDVAGVIMPRASCSNPIRNEVIVAQNEHEVLSCVGSRYSPTFTCVGLKGVQSGKCYAFVGKPCDIYALNKCKEYLTELKNAISYTVGVFCHHTPNYECTDRLLREQRIFPEQVAKIQYRGGGWPGFVRVFGKKGDVLFEQEYKKAWVEYMADTPKRCKMCVDCTAEYADISLGDAWNIAKSHKDEVGKNIIIARTQRGHDLLMRVAEVGAISIEKILLQTVLFSQKDLLSKKEAALGYLVWNKLKSNRNPCVKLRADMFLCFLKCLFNRILKLRGSYVLRGK